MRKEAMDFHWMDEYEPDLQPCLTCKIEMDNKDGETRWEVAAVTAGILRSLAAQIEAGALGNGVHPVTAPDGERIGKLYLDWYATAER